MQKMKICKKHVKKHLGRSENSHYDEELKDEGINEVLRYGIAFYKKRCNVMKSLS